MSPTATQSNFQFTYILRNYQSNITMLLLKSHFRCIRCNVTDGQFLVIRIWDFNEVYFIYFRNTDLSSTVICDACFSVKRKTSVVITSIINMQTLMTAAINYNVSVRYKRFLLSSAFSSTLFLYCIETACFILNYY